MKKILFLGIVATLLSAGLFLASCDVYQICPDTGNCKVNATWSNYYQRWSASGISCSNKDCFATQQKNNPGGVSGQDNIETCNCKM
jgi:hypothetical protein